MKKKFNIVLLLLSIFVFTNSLIASQESEIRDIFKSKLDKVLDVVQHKELSKNNRNSKIVELLTPMFDFELMAKLSLGKKAWSKLNSDEKEKFVRLYVERMKNSYSSKINSYKDEKIEVIKVIRKKNRIVLKTEVDIDNLFSDIWTKSIKPKKKKEIPKLDKRRLQAISKKIKKTQDNKVESVSQKVKSIQTNN